MTTKERNTSWPEFLTRVLDYYLRTTPSETRKELLMILSNYDYRIKEVMGLNTRQALQQYGLSDEAINMIISTVPLLGSVIYNSFEVSLLEYYTQDYLNLYCIDGGMSNLPFAFYNSLMNTNPLEYVDIPQDALGKVNWRGRQLVTGVYKSNVNDKVALSYDVLPGVEHYFENFDYVIFATPMSALRIMNIYPLFSSKKMQAIKDIFYQDSQKTLFLCNDRFWERQGILAWIPYTDRIISAIHYPEDHVNCPSNTMPCSPAEPGVLLASYNIGQEAIRLGMEGPEARFEMVKRDVEIVHGLPRNYLDNIVTDKASIDWYRERWIWGEFPTYLPGQRVDYLYVTSTLEYDNRVFFAGEHTSTKSAWIQGALQSGITAADNVAYYSTIHKYMNNHE